MAMALALALALALAMALALALAMAMAMAISYLGTRYLASYLASPRLIWYVSRNAPN